MRTSSRKKQLGFWGAIAAAVGSYLAADSASDTNDQNAQINNAQMAFNSEEARRNREFQQYEANQSRIWQENMSGSAYQRAMQDMDKAGLNPMLAFQQGGAPTGPGATASGSQASSGGQIPMQNVGQAGINGAMAAANIQNIASQTDVNEAQARKIEAEIPLTVANTGQVTQQTRVLEETIPKIKAEIENIGTQSGLNISNQTLNGYKYELTKIETELAKGNVTYTKAKEQVQRIMEKLYQYEIPEARNKANYQNKEGPSVVSPALRDLGAIINGAGQLSRMR